ncbi:MAG: GNAT family N-acetyltransferase [Planctomycetota bacterium]
MPTISHHPRLPAGGNNDPTAGGPFTQELRIADGKRTIGSVRWHTVGSDGVAQLLDLFVREPDRRQGHAKSLLTAAEKQIGKYHGRSLRRIWCQVRQQSQVKARALISGRGYQHVSTAKDLFENEDGLVYVKTFD